MISTTTKKIFTFLLNFCQYFSGTPFVYNKDQSIIMITRKSLRNWSITAFFTYIHTIYAIFRLAYRLIFETSKNKSSAFETCELYFAVICWIGVCLIHINITENYKERVNFVNSYIKFFTDISGL